MVQGLLTTVPVQAKYISSKVTILELRSKSHHYWNINISTLLNLQLIGLIKSTEHC